MFFFLVEELYIYRVACTWLYLVAHYVALRTHPLFPTFSPARAALCALSCTRYLSFTFYKLSLSSPKIIPLATAPTFWGTTEAVVLLSIRVFVDRFCGSTRVKQY